MKDLTNQCNQPVSHTSVPDPPPRSTQEAQLPPPVRDNLKANKYIKLNIFVHYLSALLLSAFRLKRRLMANTWVAKITQETLASSCTTTGVASRMDSFLKALSE